MADKREKEEREEKKIPVFTVLKNGSILKNIFLLDNPPPVPENESIESGAENGKKSWKSEKEEEEEKGEMLIVGRHPDCNIMLEHPSISRFHLRIYSKPSSRKLSVIDLSSAHGTWISDRKIEPEVRIDLNEGDTIRLGASTRVYRLHWFPLNCTFDVENLLISPNLERLLPIEEKEGEGQESNEIENQIPFEIDQNHIPSAPPMPENMNSSFTDDEEEEVLFVVPVFKEDENQSPLRRLELWSKALESDSAEEEVQLETPNQQIDKENHNPEALVSMNVLSEIEIQESPPIKSEKKSDMPNIWSRRGKSASSIQIQTGRSRAKNVEVSSTQVMEGEVVSRLLFLGLDPDAEEVLFTPDKENFTPRPVLGVKSMKKSGLEEIKNQNYSGSLKSKVINSNFNQIQTGRSRAKNVEVSSTQVMEGEVVSRVLFRGGEGEEEIFTPDKENFTPRPVLGMKSMKKGRLEEIKNQNCSGSSTSKVIISPNFDQEEGRLCSPGFDKENLTPIVLQDSKSKKSSSRDPVRLETEMILIKRQEGRVPFQSLLSPNSISKSKSEFSVPHISTTRSSNSVNCSQTIEKNCTSSHPDQSGGEANKRWNMVVDTSSLLNKDSWKSLKLLQGLKGTHLIIPRMVIRELDNLKRRGSLFRRATEVSSSSVLEWIEECMVKTSWWIHVQNSLEESMPIAPTPPASPQSLLSEGSSSSPFARSVPFSPFGSLMEIVSPTAQDHILECALLFKRIRNTEPLVLLTSDIALKIKAMAEGLICETAEEFRESLVNPYSARFLWGESIPRGSTWSCLDEAAVLREKKCYQFFPVKKTKAAEGAKGLKLILLHNSSHYGQIMNSVN
ncbi:Forkhead-associated (FHA) domain [Macleaya cordata]|uniref:Forkhead-associated (FHA) domain n=1 Tax=Macleaya cordata TaxID=56857 RepID=A0A200Q0W4_MACCD|nr:Forkhead-associated (FHA) domain [Macleaya cordata]